jgi:hypothetical protein
MRARELDQDGAAKASASDLPPVNGENFENARKKVKPSVAEKSDMRTQINDWNDKYGEKPTERKEENPMGPMYM